MTIDKSTVEKSQSDNTDGEKRKDGTREGDKFMDAPFSPKTMWHIVPHNVTVSLICAIFGICVSYFIMLWNDFNLLLQNLEILSPEQVLCTSSVHCA